MAIDQTADAVQANAQYLAQGQAMVSVAQQIQQAVAGQLAVFGGMQQAVSDLSSAMQSLPGELESVFSALQSGSAAGSSFLEFSSQIAGTLADSAGAISTVGGAWTALSLALGAGAVPFAIAAAAVAGFAVACNEGSKESDAYQKALVLTGNEVGTTVGQMHAMAASIDGVVGTHGKAAESLAIFASQSATGAATLEQYTQAAIGFERAAGQAVSETAKQFASLQGDPLNAVVKLNSGMNFLTDATYSQIKSLEEQGLMTEAAGVAQAAFADALTERTKVIEANLGTVERAWISVKNVVAEAWDAMKSVGRKVGPEGQYAAQQELVGKLQAEVDSRKASGLNAGYLESQLNAERERLEILNAEIVVNQANADLDAERAVRNKARIEVDRDGLKYLDREQKIRRQIAAENEQIKLSYTGRTDEKSLKKMEEEMAAREKAIRASAAKPRSTQPSYGTAKELSEYDKLMKHLEDMPAKAAAAEAAQTSYTKSEAEFLALKASAAWKTFSEREQKDIETKYEAVIAAERQTKANQDALQSREKYLASLSSGIEKTKAEVVAQEEANTRMGMSKEAIAALEISKLEMMAVDLELQAIKAIDKNLDEAAYALLIQQAQGYRALAQAKKDGAAKEQTQGADAQAKDSQAKAAAKAEEAAKKAQEQWKVTSESISKGLTDAFMKSLESGKDFGKNLANALKEQFKNLVLRPVIKAVMDPIAGVLNNLLSGFTGKLTGVASSGVGGGSGGLMDVFSGLGAVKTAYGAMTSSWVAPGSSYWGFATSGVGKALGFSNSAPIIGNNPSAFIPAGGQLTGLGQAVAGVIKFLPWAALIAAGMKMAGNAFDEGYRLEDRTIFKSMGIISPMMNIDTRMAQKLGFSERTANIITGASLVAKVASKLGLQATLHTGAGAVYQNGDLTEGRDIYTHGRFGMGDPREYAASAQDAVSTVAARVGVTLDSFFASFGLKPGFKVQTAFADDISKDGAWGSLRIEDSLGNKVLDWMDTKTSKWAPKEFANGEAGWKQYLDAVSDGTIDAFKKSADQLPAWANRIIAAADTAGDDTAKVLETLLQDVAAFPNQLLEKVGTSRDALVGQFVEGLATGDASAAGQAVADTLVQSVEASLYTQAAGQIFDIINTGIVTPMIDALVTGATLTDILSQQTIDSVIQRATATAAALNAVMNDPAFAALLEQLRTSTGRALGTAGSQLTYTPRYQQAAAAAATQATGELGNAVSELAQQFNSAVSSLSSDAKSLQIDLLRAQGKMSEADALERDNYLKPFEKLSASDYATLATQYDANTATRRAIDVQNERNGLQDELNALTDDATQALTRQRDALDESNRALFDNVQAVKLQKTLAQELPGVLDKYMLPAQRRKAQYDSVAKDLTAAGIGVTADQLANASKGEFAAAAMAVYNLGSTTDDMRLALVRAAGVMADIKDAEVDEAFANLQRVVGLQQEIATKTRDDIKAVFELLQSSVDELYSEVDSTARMRAAEGQDYIAKTLALAQSGEKIVDSTELGKAISAARSGLDGTQYTSQFERDKERLVLAGKLSDLEEISGEQLSEAERQVKYLDDLVKDGQTQIDELRGINGGVDDVEKAVNALADAISGRNTVASTPTVSNRLTGSGQASFDKATGKGTTSTGVYFEREAMLTAAREVLTAAPDGSGAMSVYKALESGGYSLADYNTMFGMPAGTLEAEAQKLGMKVFHRGTPFVPSTGFALLQRGEAVIPTAYNPFVHGRSLGDTARLEAHLEKLTDEVMRLQSLQTLGNTHAQATVELLDNVTEGGNGIRAEIMNKVELVA